MCIILQMSNTRSNSNIADCNRRREIRATGCPPPVVSARGPMACRGIQSVLVALCALLLATAYGQCDIATHFQTVAFNSKTMKGTMFVADEAFYFTAKIAKCEYIIAGQFSAIGNTFNQVRTSSFSHPFRIPRSPLFVPLCALVIVLLIRRV